MAPERSTDRSPCALCGSDTIRALWATFALNSAFTATQVVGSIVTHSLALGADTGTMVVDSGTYLINIFAEYVCIRGADARTTAAINAGAAGVSVVALVAVSILAMTESVGRIVQIEGNTTGTEPLPEINAQVMFAFTFGNLCIDMGNMHVQQHLRPLLAHLFVTVP